MSVSYEFDVLIIGSGLAGLSCALKLAESGKKIAIATREKDPKISNTYYAQGGIVFNEQEHEQLINDIMVASSQSSHLPAVETLAYEGPKILKEVLLEKAKTNFIKDEHGILKKTKEAAHSRARILYRDDFTGREIQISLLNYLKDERRFPNITFLTGHTAIDLITPNHHGINLVQRYEDNKILGAYLFNQETKQVHKTLSKLTVLATGGIGSLYLHHSNSEGARGDGHAMAKRAGAFISNMEFIQFHPTTFYDRSAHRRFLISEAIRGEGGVLLNSEGQVFMGKYHPDKEMAPRDIVARAINKEMIDLKDDCVYLDISHKSSEWIKKRFPTIYNHCLDRRLDITKEPIPVVPAAHYTCGGVKTDLNGRTNLKGLYAVGEVACTGLHGANRLASTSLLECLSFGYLAAGDINENFSQYSLYEPDLIKPWEVVRGDCDLALISQDWMSLKQTMWNYVGLTRSRYRLNRASAILRELSAEVQRFYRNSDLHDSLIGLRNALEVAHMVLHSSIRNNESLGCFYKND